MMIAICCVGIFLVFDIIHEFSCEKNERVDDLD